MRFFKIDWTGFACTRHWLKGNALVDYVLREAFMPRLVRDVYQSRSRFQ